MTREKQLRSWLKGKPRHNMETNECCPDFSCCIPECEATQEEKLTFCDAWVDKRYDIIDGMMMLFMSKMIIARDMDKEIYISGFVNT